MKIDTTIPGLQDYQSEAENDFQCKCQRISIPELSGLAQVQEDEKELVPKTSNTERSHPFTFEFVDNNGAILQIQAEKLLLSDLGQANNDDWLGSLITLA